MGKSRRAVWKEREATLRRFADSGLSGAEFCRRESIPYWKVQQWKAWLDALPKSPLGKAIGYALDNWAEFAAFAADARLAIDNNAVERAIRPVAVGRKNWLFAGSERGGRAVATFFTLIESARRAVVNLWDYLTDLLERLPAHPVNRLEELLPDRWKSTRA